jgi:hypothetical protein
VIDAFRIGVALNLTSNAAGVLNVLARDFMGLRHHISGTMADLTRVQVAIGGLAAMTVGVGVLKFTGDLFHAGEDLVHQQALLQAALGGTAAAHFQVAEATRAAWEATRQVPGSTVVGNLETVADLRNVFGSMAEAMAFMPRFAQMAQILADVGGKVSAAGGGAAFLAARAMELRGGLIGPDGQVDAAQMMHQLDLLTRVEVATRGRVDPRQFLNFVQQARAAGMNLDDDALFGTLPALILAMGGMRAGTGLQTAWRAAVTGRMTKQGAHVAESLGLLAPGVMAPGTPEVATTRGLVHGDEFARDPVQWVIGTLLPALRAHGFTSDTDIAKEIGRIFTDRTAAGFITEIARNAASILKEQQNIRQASGASIDFEGHDPAQALRDFTSAWHNLMTVLGSPLVAPGIRMLGMLTDALDSITKWIGEPHFDPAQVHRFLSDPFGAMPPETHSPRAEVIGKVLAGLGAFLVAAGAIAVTGSVLAFIVGGGAAGALAAILGGIAALAVTLKADDWQALWDHFLAPFRLLRYWLTGTLPGGGGLPDLTPETRRRLDERREREREERGRRGGFLPNEPGISPQNYAAPPPQAPIIKIYLDGSEVAGALIRRVVHQASGPIAGNPAFDGRRLYAT